MTSSPAVSADLKLRADGGVALVNSRDVAEAFEKAHDKVNRDIKALEISPELAKSWFRSATVLDAYGHEQPSFDMTRQGFTLLVMGWTGERTMAFKVRYIEAFDAMEAALHQPRSVVVSTDQLISAVREIVAPLAVRFDGQDHAIERIETDVGVLKEDMAFVKGALKDGSGSI